MRMILDQFDLYQQNPTHVYYNNQGNILLIRNLVDHQKTKHNDIWMHYIRYLY